MLRFLIDAQLPAGLARRLEALGFEALHVEATSLREAADRDIWNFAAANNYVVISEDADFVVLSNLSSTGPSVVWIRLGNVANVKLWESLGPLMPDIVARLGRGEKLIEVKA